MMTVTDCLSRLLHQWPSHLKNAEVYYWMTRWFIFKDQSDARMTSCWMQLLEWWDSFSWAGGVEVAINSAWFFGFEAPRNSLTVNGHWNHTWVKLYGLLWTWGIRPNSHQQWRKWWSAIISFRQFSDNPVKAHQVWNHRSSLSDGQNHA